MSAAMKRWTYDDREHLRALWARGDPAHEIAQRLGVTVMAVFCQRFAMRLPSRSKVRAAAVEPAADARGLEPVGDVLERVIAAMARAVAADTDAARARREA